MTKRMSATDAKNRWGDLVRSIAQDGEPVIVENRREPVLIAISPADFDALQAYKKEMRLRQFRESLQRIQDAQAGLTSDLTEDEAEALVQQAMEEDRQERKKRIRAAR